MSHLFFAAFATSCVYASLASASLSITSSPPSSSSAHSDLFIQALLSHSLLLLTFFLASSFLSSSSPGLTTLSIADRLAVVSLEIRAHRVTGAHTHRHVFLFCSCKLLLCQVFLLLLLAGWVCELVLDILWGQYSHISKVMFLNWKLHFSWFFLVLCFV